MPEYLAPGVYVEETSYRAKSIEGVGTSTTGFVGPTRTGPVGGTPELLTSFGDFVRIYGGLNALSYGTNYLAHSVLNYFNEGGVRLYVSRVFLSASAGETGIATSANVVNGADAAHQAHFTARFPGAAGNSTLVVSQVEAPASARSMLSAQPGTLLRLVQALVGKPMPRDRLLTAAPAQIQGGVAPFALPNDGHLTLTVPGAGGDVVFHGEPAQATGTVVLADPLTLVAPDNVLAIAVDGQTFTISLPIVSTARADIVTAITAGLKGAGTASLDAGQHLVITGKRAGKLSSVTVSANATFGFDGTTQSGGAIPANNVGDLSHVTVDEINTALAAANAGVRAVLASATGRIVLTTVTTGNAAALTVATPGTTINALVGLPVNAIAKGSDGPTTKYYVKDGNSWKDSTGAALDLTTLSLDDPTQLRGDLLTISLLAQDLDGTVTAYENLAFDRRHPRWIGNILPLQPKRRIDSLQNKFAIVIGDSVDAFALHDGLFATGNDRAISLTGGNDGVQPNQFAYSQTLQNLANLSDIAIVAAPGAAAYADAQGITGALISHAEGRRAYRIAVLDTPPNLVVSEARAFRGQFDSTYGAMYYPWITVSNPLARPNDDSQPPEINLPPSGFLAGIYARNDIARGVFKAPANEVVRAALRFESDINFAQQEVLNPLGVNCLRFFEGRGYRVWGARTVSSDPEWKYVNVRRYFNYLENSIDQGTQWSVFEPNGERLWSNIRDTIEGFLYNEWLSGALLGGSPKEAYFVRCDRSTMTQNDLDNGRLICQIGVAVIKPAEFVIFRIGQKTADARS